MANNHRTIGNVLREVMKGIMPENVRLRVDKRGFSVPIQKHLSGEIKISKDIWKWINLELWFREYID